MSKISKFIICCIALIISIVSLCVPTYCADISSALYDIDLVNEFPNENNYYNINNISYVKYENFVITRSIGNCFYSTSVSSLPSSFYNGQEFIDNYYISVSNQVLAVESKYRLILNSNSFLLSSTYFNVTNLDDFSLSLGLSDVSSVFSFRWIPFEFFEYLGGDVNSMHLYGSFIFTYDIVYNGQYFYNDVFCFTNDIALVSGINKYPSTNYPSAITKTFLLTDNKNDTYSEVIDGGSSNFNYKKLYFKNLLYTDRYITNVSSKYTLNTVSFGNQTNLGRLYMQYYIKFLDYDQTESINIYSGSSTGSGGAVGSLIPNGSNNFYKTAEWWDIPSHLYNFFIYLIFDAPIISNFTSLVIIIINFIVELFDFIIGLFTGINNVFFISIFVGIIILIFLLKIIFMG